MTQVFISSDITLLLSSIVYRFFFYIILFIICQITGFILTCLSTIPLVSLTNFNTVLLPKAFVILEIALGAGIRRKRSLHMKERQREPLSLSLSTESSQSKSAEQISSMNLAAQNEAYFH